MKYSFLTNKSFYLLLLLLLLCSVSTYSQTNFIVDKKGNKTIIRDDNAEIILIDKRISYTLVGKTWEKYIKFEDLDYARIGNTTLKAFKLNNKKKPEIYFVFAEKKDKKLIGLSWTVTSTAYNITLSRTFYQMHVIDNDDNIIESVGFTSKIKDGEVDDRVKLAPMIRNHFSDCPKLLEILNQYDSPSENNLISITGFFYNPIFIECD